MTEEKTITSFDGARIFYHITRRKKNKHLIFLHGLGGDLTAWKNERKHFDSLGFSTIAMDLRGHGFSARSNEASFYSLENMTRDVAFIAAEEKVKSAVIIGHCFGGIVAMNLATSKPLFLKSLILIDTSYKPPFLGNRSIDKIFLKHILNLFSNHFPDIHTEGHANFSRFVGTEDIDMRRFLSDVRHTSLKSYLLICGNLVNYNGEELLEKIIVPTLVITGSLDTIFPPHIAVHIANRIKGSNFDLIKNANHILIINNPQDVNASIEKFIEKIDFLNT